MPVTKNLRIHLDKGTNEVHISLDEQVILQGELFLATQEHYKSTSVYQFTVDVEE